MRPGLQHHGDAWRTDDGYELKVWRGKGSKRLIGELLTPANGRRSLAGGVHDRLPDILDWADQVIAEDRLEAVA
jgi:hypothetical protein